MATGYRETVFVSPDAGVVKLVDAGDSKSPGPCVHVGSIPTSGTTFFKGLHVLRVNTLVHRFGSGVHIVSTENLAQGLNGLLLMGLGEVGIPHGHLKGLVVFPRFCRRLALSN